MEHRASRIRRGGLAFALAVGLTVTAAPVAAHAGTAWTVSGSVYDIYGQSIQRFRVQLQSTTGGGYAAGDFNGGTFSLTRENGSYTLQVKPDGLGDFVEPGMTVVVHDAPVTGILAVVDLDEAPPPPTNAASIELQGQAVLGQTLSVSGVPAYPGTPGIVSYNSAPVYLWWRDDGMIPGANDPSYTLTPDDVGKRIGVSVITHPSGPNALRFGVMEHYLEPTGPVAQTFAFGAPTLTRTLNSVTLPKDEAAGLAYTLSVPGSADGGGLSYAMGDTAGSIPAPSLLGKNGGVPISAVKRPTIESLAIHAGANPAQVSMTPDVTPGKYRINLPVTQWLNGTAQATQTATTTLTVNANISASKARTHLTRTTTRSGGYSLKINAPAYQTGASVTLYDKLGSGTYRKVATGKLKAKSGKSTVTLTVAKKYVGKGTHTYYANVGAVTYAPKYNTTAYTYRK